MGRSSCGEGGKHKMNPQFNNSELALPSKLQRESNRFLELLSTTNCCTQAPAHEPLRLGIVIKVKLGRVGTGGYDGDFSASFVIDPSLHSLGREDITARQVIMIDLDCRERIGQGFGESIYLVELCARLGTRVLGRGARRKFLLNTIKRRHGDGAESQVRIGAGVGGTELNSPMLGARRSRRHADRGSSIVVAERQTIGGELRRGQSSVAVGCGASQGGQRACMFQQTTDRVQSLIAEPAVPGAGKQRITTALKSQLGMDTGAEMVTDRFRHKRGGSAQTFGNSFNDILGNHYRIGRLY